jgi:Calcineurin-like phosphoesterase
MSNRFDVIGDVHGEFDKLVELLKHLNYRESSGTWRHPDRTAIFVGDLIDRGPKQLATVALVRGMVEAGAAQCILGNHEFNAIAWVTPNPERPGKFLRDHHKPGNREQHQVFLDVVEGSLRQKEITDWFRTLPLWLDLPGLRVVHACWHEESMEVLRPVLTEDHTLSDEAVLLGSQPGNPIFEALEIVCKGPELALPLGLSFPDKEGKIRHDVRVRWWLPEVKTFREAAIVPPGREGLIPDVPLPGEWKGHAYSGPPVLFGHYWFSSKPAVISSKFACLDYSVAQGGPLVAYRWDGETELADDKLAWVDSAR